MTQMDPWVLGTGLHKMLHSVYMLCIEHCLHILVVLSQGFFALGFFIGDRISGQGRMMEGGGLENKFFSSQNCWVRPNLTHFCVYIVIQKDLTLRAEGPKRAAQWRVASRARGVGLWP